jgi:hypothetical protein
MNCTLLYTFAQFDEQARVSGDTAFVLLMRESLPALVVPPD